MVFHGTISINKKYGIGSKWKNGSSFKRHKDAIAETEVVDQPTAETTSTETKQPPQKLWAENQWRVAREIVSHDKMVQKITMERDFLRAWNTSLQGHVEKAKAATSKLAHQKFWMQRHFELRSSGIKRSMYFPLLNFVFNSTIIFKRHLQWLIEWPKKSCGRRKIIKGAVDHKIKMKAERKNVKEKLEKEPRG